MQTVIDISDRLVKTANNSFKRYLHDSVSWEERLVGIIGAKGTGKTTMLLQRIKQNFPEKRKAPYASLDNIWFAKNSLWNLAEQFNAYGGTHLFLDEVHKYPSWAREIKNIYDSFPDLNIVFTGSSMLEIYKQSVDLSRRAVSYELKGLSFREFLEFEYGKKYQKYELEEILTNHREIANEIIFDFKILPAFKKYIQVGYYPFYKKSKINYYYAIQQSINKTLEGDSLAKSNANQGNLRETFFTNQIKGLHSIKVAKSGDFVIDGKYTFEIGGKNKTGEQIKNTSNAFVVADDMESGFQNKIPLWLFGFLY